MSAPLRIAVAQLGAREDYSIPVALTQLGYLERFYTDLYLQPRERSLVAAIARLPKLGNVARKTLSRHNTNLAAERVERFNLLGLQYLQALRRAKDSEALYRAFLDYGRAFERAVLAVGLPADLTHLYAFDHAACTLFEASKQTHPHCRRILNQIYPALYEETLEREEETRWPGWAIAPRAPFYDSATFAEWQQVQQAEWDLADTIIVNSTYSGEAIARMAPSARPKLQVVPLTVNLAAYRPYQRLRRYDGKRPLRALFVGTVGLRKGIPDLLAAFAQIPPEIAQLRVIGNNQLNPTCLARYADRVEFSGSIPHADMPAAYDAADLFVFPTISDGFGAVLLEAMAVGLPAIATPHCSDIVVDGVNGWRVPIRTPAAIVDKILALHRQPERLTELSRGAIATTADYTLATYRERLCQAIAPSS